MSGKNLASALQNFRQLAAKNQRIKVKSAEQWAKKKAQKKAAEEAAAAAAAAAAAEAAAAAAAAERAARGTDWSETVISRAEMLPGASDLAKKAAGGVGGAGAGAAAAATTTAAGAPSSSAAAAAAAAAAATAAAAASRDALRASVLVAGVPLAKQVKDALWALKRSRSGRNPRGGLKGEAISAATGFDATSATSALRRALESHPKVSFDASSGLFTYKAAHSASDPDGLVDAVRAATMLGGGGGGGGAASAATKSAAVSVATFAPGAGLPAAELDDAYPGAGADVAKLVASGRLWSAPAAADFGQTAVLFVGVEGGDSANNVGGGGGRKQRAAAAAAAAAARAAATAAAATDASAALGARPVSRSVAELWASHPPPPDASALAAGLKKWYKGAAALPASRSASAARRAAALAPKTRVRKQRDPNLAPAPRVMTNAHMPELWSAGGPTSID